MVRSLDTSTVSVILVRFLNLKKWFSWISQLVSSGKVSSWKEKKAKCARNKLMSSGKQGKVRKFGEGVKG